MTLLKENVPIVLIFMLVVYVMLTLKLLFDKCVH